MDIVFRITAGFTYIYIYISILQAQNVRVNPIIGNNEFDSA